MFKRATTAAIAALLLCATSAHAIDKCKVKVSKKTGLIEVTAIGVGGTLLWGTESGSETTPFNNAGTCLDGDKAKKCNLADPATVDAKTPPSDCTLYFDDSVLACSAWVPGCVPGLRDSPVCVPNPSASPRYIDNGDGTVSDQTTCLMWEQKTGSATGYDTGNACPGGPNCGDPHHADNLYVWNTGSPYNPDGPAFFDFLAELNGPSPFVGHDDWRLPTITELEGIVDLSATGCGVGSPCIDPVFGPTQSAGSYWSSSTYQVSPQVAWNVFFGIGGTSANLKTINFFVRAVRAGS